MGADLVGLASATGIVAGALAAVGGLVLWGVRALQRTLRGVGDLVDDWRGEPARPGVAARPGVMQRLETFGHQQTDLINRVGRIEAELHPNGGATVRDAVNRIERKIELSIGEGSG